MNKIILIHPRAGSEKITMYLHKAGVKINHKKIERIYSENKLQLKNLKKGHKKYSVNKLEKHILSKLPGKWLAMDFVIDSIANRQRT